MIKKLFVFRSMIFRSQKGFTMIELLVVMAVIGILSSIAYAGFGNVQQRARDGRRRSDMQTIQRGFEQYFTLGNTYAACSTMFNNTSIFPQGVPLDPINTGTTVYSAGPSCTASPSVGYCYCSLLERANTGNSGANCAYSSATKNYFCVSQLQ